MAEHFNFCDWEKAFAAFYEKSPADPSLALVISKHWATSGYWLERDAKPTKHEPELLAYRTLEEVKALEQRIKDKREEKAFYDERSNFVGYPASLGELVV